MNEVINNLFELFDHLGIDFSQVPHAGQSTTRPSTYSQHPLYPYAHAIGELLTLWHQDPDYLDDSGNPRLIKLRGRRPSFQNLARRTVPKMEMQYLLSELERLGVVSSKDGLLQVHMRSFPAYEDKSLAIEHTLNSLDGFIRTLRHNLNSPSSNSDQLFHRIAQRLDFDNRDVPALKVKVKRQGQAFLESFDNWLMKRPISKHQKGTLSKGTIKVSVGVYLSLENR